MEMTSLRELYIAELKDLYSAEKQLVKALPKMAKSATNPELQRAFENHLAETKGHVERLEEIFQSLEAAPGGKHCKGMEGLIEEGSELMEEDAQEDVLDAGLISKAQHVEHYEIAGYGTVRTYAEILGENEHAKLLQQTLDEEAAADRLLTELAGSINIDAAIGDETSASSRTYRGREREVERVAQSDRSDTSAPSERDRSTRKDVEREARDR
jgi:ferritin-like metal-binding protein YciE